MAAPINRTVDAPASRTSPLVRAAVTLRRFGSIAASLVAVSVMGTLVASGAFADEGRGATGLGIAWLAVLAVAIWRRRHERYRELQDGVIALHLVAGAFAAIDITGGIESDFYPLLYVMVAFLVAMSHRLVAVVSIATAVLLEANLWLRHGSIDDTRRLAIHASCIVFFALLHVFFTRGEIARLRLAGKKMIEDERAKTLDAARDFRLSAAPRTNGAEPVGGSRAQAESRLATASVEQIRQSIYQTLDLLKRTMGLHTAALLWLDPAGTNLKLAEIATDSDDVDPGPFPSTGGAPGAALKRRSVVNLDSVRVDYRGIPYYRSGVRVSRFVAVPVLEGAGGHLRGVLCADRTGGPAFTPEEEDILRAATRSILHTVENERTFVQTERAKWEQSRLYRASEALGSALGEEQVLDATLRAVREITEYDFAAVTYYDSSSRRHSVRRADGPLRERFEGLEFRDSSALAAMAVKNRSSLPYRGEFDAQKSTVFTPSARLDGMQSLIILPLVASDQAIGSLTIAASRKDAFGATVRPILEIISNQMAVCIANAQMLRRLEELATTDGLTGLANHRVFQEELDSRLKSAARFGRKLSVILLDIDHFKRVNDEHGHPVGDAVLRNTARLLERCKRETDLVARYGGEEFVIVCEETDRKGASLLAERIRRELEGQPLAIDGGKLRVTCSLGMATYPLDASAKADLVSRADQALYQAKRGGRNRAVAWGQPPARQSQPAG